jgi:hypothetical protein
VELLDSALRLTGAPLREFLRAADVTDDPELSRSGFSGDCDHPLVGETGAADW